MFQEDKKQEILSRMIFEESISVPALRCLFIVPLSFATMPGIGQQQNCDTPRSFSVASTITNGASVPLSISTDYGTQMTSSSVPATATDIASASSSASTGFGLQITTSSVPSTTTDSTTSSSIQSTTLNQLSSSVLLTSSSYALAESSTIPILT